MRDIEFRGQEIEFGRYKTDKWIYGYFTGYYEDGNGCIQNSSPFIGNCVKVIPDTVGQFTGLKDKNGVKIFEGDILRYERENHHNPFDPFIELSSVEYKNGGFYLIPDEECLYSGECLEVIGNIHDNPELLKA